MNLIISNYFHLKTLCPAQTSTRPCTMLYERSVDGHRFTIRLVEIGVDEITCLQCMTRAETTSSPGGYSEEFVRALTCSFQAALERDDMQSVMVLMDGHAVVQVDIHSVSPEDPGCTEQGGLPNMHLHFLADMTRDVAVIAVALQVTMTYFFSFSEGAGFTTTCPQQERRRKEIFGLAGFTPVTGAGVVSGRNEIYQVFRGQ